MPKLIEIPGVGDVEFPDDMSDDAISATIEKDIMPNYAKSASVPAVSGTTTPAAPTPVSTVPAVSGDRKAESGYRDIAARFLGKGTTAQSISQVEPSGYEKAKGSLNEIGDANARLAGALKDSAGDIDKAYDAVTKKSKEQDAAMALAQRYMGMNPAGYVIPEKQATADQGAAKLLTDLKAELDAAGVPAAERPRIIQDAARANAWTEKDTDNTRKLSTGEIAINPGRLFGQRDKLIAEINSTDTTPEDKTEAINRLDALRAASAEKISNDLYYGDTRLPGATEFRDFLAEKEAKGQVGDLPAVLDQWSAQQKDRNVAFKFIDSIVSGVAKGGLGIEKTVVGGLAGAAALTGIPGAETLAAGQQLLGAASESASQAEKFRGADGITNEIFSTVTQMAPMFIGGAAAQGLKGLSQTAVQGMSVYGWAAAQGYESKLSDAVDMAKQAKGSELTPKEVTEVLGRRDTQVAGLLNGFQTAILSSVFKGGAERAALGQAAGSMTVKDFIIGGGAKALRDGALKTELKAMAKTVLKDATDESVEEFTNQLLDGAISTVALGKDMKLGDLMEQSFKAGALGGLVGGALPQLRSTPKTDPATEAARDLEAAAAPLGPQSAAASMETGTVIGTDGNPIVPNVIDPGSGLVLDSQAQAGLAAPISPRSPISPTAETAIPPSNEAPPTPNTGGDLENQSGNQDSQPPIPLTGAESLAPESAASLARDTSHLDALEVGLSRARDYARNAKTPQEQQSRDLSVKQYEKEIADERKFLGMPKPEEVDMSDTELLAALEEPDTPKAKTRMDLILDGVDKHGEVNLTIDGEISREQINQVTAAAEARGMTAAFDGSGFLIRKSPTNETPSPKAAAEAGPAVGRAENNLPLGEERMGQASNNPPSSSGGETLKEAAPAYLKKGQNWDLFAAERASEASAPEEFQNPVSDTPNSRGVSFTPEMVMDHLNNAAARVKDLDGQLMSGKSRGASPKELTDMWVRSERAKNFIAASRKANPDVWADYDARQKEIVGAKEGDTVLTPFASTKHPTGSPAILKKKFSKNWRVEMDGREMLLPPSVLRPSSAVSEAPVRNEKGEAIQKARDISTLISKAYPFKGASTSSDEKKFIAKVKVLLKPFKVNAWQIDSAVDSIKTRKARSNAGKISFVHDQDLIRQLVLDGTMEDPRQEIPQSTNETPTTQTPAAPSTQEDLPEAVPQAGVQPTPSGPAVGGSETLKSPRDSAAAEYEDMEKSALQLVKDTVNGGFLRGAKLEDEKGGYLLVTKPSPGDATNTIFRVTQFDNQDRPSGHIEVSEDDWSNFKKNPDHLRMSELGSLMNAARNTARADVFQSADLGLGGKPIEFSYKLRNRAATKGAYPEEGFLKKDGDNVVYSRALTRQQLDSYEMVPIGAKDGALEQPATTGESVESEEVFAERWNAIKAGKPKPRSNQQNVAEALTKESPTDWADVKLSHIKGRPDVLFGEQYGQYVVNTAYVTPKQAVQFVKELISRRTQPTPPQTQGPTTDRGLPAEPDSALPGGTPAADTPVGEGAVSYSVEAGHAVRDATKPTPGGPAVGGSEGAVVPKTYEDHLADYQHEAGEDPSRSKMYAAYAALEKLATANGLDWKELSQGAWQAVMRSDGNTKDIITYLSGWDKGTAPKAPMSYVSKPTPPSDEAVETRAKEIFADAWKKKNPRARATSKAAQEKWAEVKDKAIGMAKEQLSEAYARSTEEYQRRIQPGINKFNQEKAAYAARVKSVEEAQALAKLITAPPTAPQPTNPPSPETAPPQTQGPTTDAPAADTQVGEGAVPYSVEALKTALNLTEEQAVVADAIRKALGAKIDLVAKGGKPGSGALSQFAGESANLPTFMQDSLDTAKTMAAAGKSSEEIRVVTGWFPGKYDGKMRWEIPDAGAKANPLVGVIGSDGVQALREGKTAGTTLGELLDHPALFEAYPDLKDVAVVLDPKTTGGKYQNKSDSIRIPAKEAFLSDRSLSTLLHEIQHAIQQREGTAKGGSPNQFRTGWRMADEDYQALSDEVGAKYRVLSLWEKARKEGTTPQEGAAKESKLWGFDTLKPREKELLETFKSEAEARKFWQMDKDRLDKYNDEHFFEPDRKYRRTAGEIEARDIQARAKLTPEQLKATAPYSSENIAPEAAIVLFQDAKASFEITETGKILLRGLQNPDFTSAVHEIAHAARRSMSEVLDPKEVATVEQWAGVKKDGKWGRYSEEKWARAWERYFAEGKAPTPRLKEIFDKIAGWMAEVYTTIKGSPIDVEISPEVRAIFDKLAARMVDTLPAEMVSPVPSKNFTQTPDRIQTPAGAMFTEDGSDLPPAIPYTPENIDKIGEAATPEEAMEQFAGVIRGLLEQQSTPPPEVEAPTDEDWNPEGLFSLQERRSLEEAEQYGLDSDWKQARRTFGALWQHAVNVEAKHKGTGTAGSDFLDRMIMEGDPDRVLKDWEVALLTHEGLKRKMDVQRTMNTVIDTTVNGKRDTLAAADMAHKEALTAYQALHNIAAGARTASGRALNAWKHALRDDFSYATLYTRHMTSINSARKQQTSMTVSELQTLWTKLMKMGGRNPKPKPNGLVTELPAAEQEAIRKYAEAQEARAAELALLTSKLEGKDTLIEEQKALIAELRAEKKAGRSKSAVSEATKKTILDRVSKAAAEARERLAAASAILPDDPNVLYQAASNSVDPLWGDRVLVMAESLLREPNMTDARFEALVKLRFGDSVAAAAVDLRKDTETHLRETMEDVTGVHVPTPVEALNGIASDTKVTREMVIDLARAHIYEGARDSEIIDRVTESLGEVFPEIERTEVAQLFTRYGEMSEKTPDELKKALDNARSLELVQKQIEDLESSGVMKRTGRAKQEASDKLLALRKKRADLAKELGYNPVDHETQLSSPQNAAKRRMENEIKELQNALDSGNARVRVRRGVDYTPDMEAMRDELIALRKTYEETFGQERTPEEINRMLAKDLDRRIATEESLIERGLLAEPEVAKAAFIESAEVSARRQKLSDLRQQKRDNYEAAHPGETALKQAKDAAQKAVQKRLDVLSGNAPATKAKKERGEGVAPDQDLMRLWKAADAMTDYIAEIRRRRPLTPEQQQKRLDDSYDTAVKTREELRRRIKQGDIVPSAKTPRLTNARNEAVRTENAALRKQILQMQKDAKVGPFDYVLRERKRFEGLSKRLAELIRKKADKDYSQKVRTEPTTSARIRTIEQDTFLAKMAFETDRAKFVFESLGFVPQVLSRMGALYQSRMLFNLTGDFGVVDRQLGKTNIFLVSRDIKNMWAKFKAGEKVKLSETMVADTYLKAYRSFMKDDNHVGLYRDMVTDPRYAFHKQNGFRLLNPHDTSHELNAEGQVRLNPLTVLNDKWLAGLMVMKGLVKIGAGVATAGWAWKTGMKGVAETVLGVATAIYGRKAAIRIERANTTILNVARWHILESALTLQGSVDPSISPDYAKDVTIGVMTYTGQTAGTGMTSKFIKNNAYVIGGFISFPQYRWTNLQSVLFGPLARLGFFGLPNEKRQAMKALSTVHGYWLAGTAAKMMVSAALLGIWDDDDEESGTWGFGVVVNKNHPYFGCLKIGKTYIDTAAGARVWLSDAAQMLSGNVVDRTKLAEGVVEEQENSAWNRTNAADNFLNKILNPNIRTAMDITIRREFRKGGDLSRMGFWNQWDTVNDEIMMNLTLQEGRAIFKEHGPVRGGQIFGQLLLGDNVSILENEEAKDLRKDKESLKYTDE